MLNGTGVFDSTVQLEKYSEKIHEVITTITENNNIIFTAGRDGYFCQFKVQEVCQLVLT